MALYEWKCKRCGTISTSMVYGEKPDCQLCGNTVEQRIYSFFAPVSFQPHWNSAVGAYVTSQRDFDDKLKALGEAQTLRTGIEHNYVSVPLADSSAFNITEEGHDDFHRTRRDTHVSDPDLDTILNN